MCGEQLYRDILMPDAAYLAAPACRLFFHALVRVLVGWALGFGGWPRGGQVRGRLGVKPDRHT